MATAESMASKYKQIWPEFDVDSLLQLTVKIVSVQKLLSSYNMTGIERTHRREQRKIEE